MDRQIRSLVLCVDLVGSRRILAAQVGWAVGRVGSRRVPSDRADDQRDDQVPRHVRRWGSGGESAAIRTLDLPITSETRPV